MSKALAISKVIKRTLVNTIKSAKTDRPFIFLSGGADSNTLLFAALESGKKPIALSFHMDGILSRDFKQAKATAEIFGVPFIEVVLPTDIDTLKKDCTTLAMKYGCRGKSDFECVWPMYRAFSVIAKYAKKNKIASPTIFTGHAADIYYVLSKKGNMHYKDRPDDYRNERFVDPKLSQRHVLPLIAADLGISNQIPWVDKKILKAFQGSSLTDVNKPRQKEPSRLAFEDYFERTRIYQHTNFQLGDSGIAKHFECLLGDDDWNPDGKYRAVIGVYNELCRRLGVK
jgi:hypothetical protein